MKTQFVEVAGLGRCQLVQNLGSHFIIEDASGTRQRLPAESCLGYITDEAGEVVGAVIPPPPDADADADRIAFAAHADAAIAAAYSTPEADKVTGYQVGDEHPAADQFTGRDLGAAMAAAERDVNQPVYCRDCALCERIEDEENGYNQEVGLCRATAQFRSRDLDRICSDFTQAPPLPVSFLREA